MIINIICGLSVPVCLLHCLSADKDLAWLPPRVRKVAARQELRVTIVQPRATDY